MTGDFKAPIASRRIILNGPIERAHLIDQCGAYLIAKVQVIVTTITVFRPAKAAASPFFYSPAGNVSRDMRSTLS